MTDSNDCKGVLHWLIGSWMIKPDDLMTAALMLAANEDTITSYYCVIRGLYQEAASVSGWNMLLSLHVSKHAPGVC